MITEIFKLTILQIIVIVLIYILVMLFVVLDLWSGCRKARQRGEYRSSYGLRKTIDKIVRYYNLLLIITLIDVAQMVIAFMFNKTAMLHIPLIPIFTMLAGVFVGFIELKSVWEKNDKKERVKAQETAELLIKLAKSNDNVISAFVEFLQANEINNKNIGNENINKA